MTQHYALIYPQITIGECTVDLGTTDLLPLFSQGVESERCASFTASLEAGKPVYTKTHSTLADGLAVPLVGVNAFATAAPLIDKMVIVR